MRGPTVAVSYSGLLGGGERLLLDMADGLPDPPLIACPAGPLADAARGRGLGVFELRPRSLALRNSAFDRVAAPARVAAQGSEVRALTASLRPGLLIAWGMRAGAAVHIAFARGRRPPLLLQHNDLLPGPLVARTVRRAAAAADAVVALSECVARDLDPTRALGARLHVVRPGVDLERFFRHSRPVAWSRRRCSCSERSSRGSAPTSRWRWLRSPPASFPTCACAWPANRSGSRDSACSSDSAGAPHGPTCVAG